MACKPNLEILLILAIGMAFQTGIKASDALKNAFNLGKQAKLRMIKAVVKNKELYPNYEYDGSSNWKDDWEATLPECVNIFIPCYILFRLNGNTEWVLITFADDRAPVKEKMMLAACCVSLKSEFGHIEYEWHVTDRKDLSLESFEAWLKGKSELGPMRKFEQDLYQVAQQQSAEIHCGPQHVKGIILPLDRNAEDAIKNLAARSLNFVQLSIDTLNNVIKLENTEENLATDKLAMRIPQDQPRYTFFRFDHTRDGRPLSDTIFIYSLPSSGSTIKERMLYCKCKAPFLHTVTNFLGVNISKKMEVDALDDLSEAGLLEALQPSPIEPPKSFAKPKRPHSVLPRRIAKV